jgi:hypothetical protein
MKDQKQQSSRSGVLAGGAVGLIIAGLSYTGYILGATQSGLADYTNFVSVGAPILIAGVVVGCVVGFVGVRMQGPR